ncbi:hypothetical protein J437_LFUL003271, partial [Ladona fulva]
MRNMEGYEGEIRKDSARGSNDRNMFESHASSSYHQSDIGVPSSNCDNTGLNSLYLKKFHYLNLGASDDSCANNDKNIQLASTSESGYGRILPKAVDGQGRSLSTNAMVGAQLGASSSIHDGGINSSGGSRSLPSSTLGSPVRSLAQDGKHHLPQQRSVGAIESLVVEGSPRGKTKQRESPIDYKIYDRGNIIAASKFATPKQVETVAAVAPPTQPQGKSVQSSAIPAYNTNGLPEPSRYYHQQQQQPQFSSKGGTASPTPSIASSNRDSHSCSPRTSMVGAAPLYSSGCNVPSPVYENLEYYGRGNPAQGAYLHSPAHSSVGSQDSKHSSPRGSVVSTGETIPTSSTFPPTSLADYRRAQPQVPVGSRSRVGQRDQPPYEAPPVYENVQDLNLSMSRGVVEYEPARPGPQVAVSRSEQKIVDNGGVYTEMRSLPAHLNAQNVESKPQHYFSSSSHSVASSSVSNPGIAPPPPYPGWGQGRRVAAEAARRIQGPMPTGLHRATPMQQNSAANGEDYVPMGSIPRQPVASPGVAGLVYVTSGTPTGRGGPTREKVGGPEVGVAVGRQTGLVGGSFAVATVPNPLPQPSPAPSHHSPSPPPSPSPAQSPASGKPKGPITGKPLLPYSVTPPRPMGPTEAERKIEELTRQLEEEMEKQGDEGEYF